MREKKIRLQIIIIENIEKKLKIIVEPVSYIQNRAITFAKNYGCIEKFHPHIYIYTSQRESREAALRTRVKPMQQQHQPIWRERERAKYAERKRAYKAARYLYTQREGDMAYTAREMQSANEEGKKDRWGGNVVRSGAIRFGCCIAVWLTKFSNAHERSNLYIYIYMDLHVFSDRRSLFRNFGLLRGKRY